MAHPSVERGENNTMDRLTDALTADEHFQQAGFRALLREDM
jgi:hypothetical protein